MKKIKTYIILFTLCTSLLTYSCIEQIDVETLTFERVLVVEATITNELKHQVISLSKSFSFEEDFPSAETNAKVSIIDNLQNNYTFYESFPGNYISNQEFQAQPNTEYTLLIITNDGKSFQSKPSLLTNITQIDDVYASREFDNFNNEGMAIFVDSYDPQGNSKYYRYEYEETYKIVAPYWTKDDFVIVSNTRPFRYTFAPKTTEQLTCYNTINSNTIIQTETTDLLEDKVSNFIVRFIPRTNAIISHTYSILVKQYVQSIDAYTFYKTLDKLSDSDNLFSQNQPGFFSGNIVSTDNPNQKVLGFFEVSSVSSKRIFFDYLDFFEGEPMPPYFVECKLGAPSMGSFPGDTFPPEMYQKIESGLFKYYGPNPNYPNPLDETEGPYLVVDVECGDCTKLGTNVKPDFWE